MAQKSYYQSNALIEALRAQGVPREVYIPKRGEWFLVYGSDNFEPNFTMHVTEDGVQRTSIAPELLNCLSTNLELTILDDNSFEFSNSVNSVRKKLNADSVIENMISLNLIKQGSPKWKGFNSASSSPYHDIQARMNLFGGVTDIDLMRLSAKPQPRFIFELKRSYIPPQTWLPYKADLGGYRIQYNLAKRLGARLLIVYWQRTKNPWFENLQQIKITEYDGNDFKFVEMTTIQKFLQDYLN